MTTLVVTSVLFMSIEVHLSQASINSSVKTKLIHSHQTLPLDDYKTYTSGKLARHYFLNQDLIRSFNVSVNGSDVIVFLRIQKTGSTTFARHMQEHFNVSPWCQCNQFLSKQCDCYEKWKSNVLFQRTITDWPCGLHADWTYLHECAEGEMNERHGQEIKQRHLYVTMVRDPLRRFVSEWEHVVRGASWKGVKRICNGHAATKAELPRCFRRNWINVTLHDFIDCSTNLGINRQTRMLANLSIVGCYNTSASGLTYDERHYLMLASAKDNLRNMAFFGLTGHQELSQILFEKTFNLNFITKFKDTPPSKTWSGKAILSNVYRNKILHINRFDVMLYQYAKDLFFQRLQMLAERTKDFSLRNFILMRLVNNAK
ncbi:heparan-sulfate 6-O-sulfotransferase 3-B-like [Haliotis cracherodii]|uniref:heparan-sulfate 6-O-sulfotransferase 3-B-like n=1 Tax=Haliotis cracherodii TaxID=6455 RepID=UPI0039E99B61